ncbi:MAG: hypothetical protein PHE83_15000 [Opitutaceae bacterium]|nr:hypothetical protein [Opitutaceae bacterium]
MAMKQIRRVILAFLMLSAGSALPLRAQAGDPPLAKDGTPSAAVVNGYTKALGAANLNGDFGNAYRAYRESRGPLFKSLNFNFEQFLGGATTNDPTAQVSNPAVTESNPIGLMALVRLGFILSLLVTFMAAAIGVVKGRGALSDLGWALAKTFLGLLMFFYAGFIYALIVTFPVLIGNVVIRASRGQTGQGAIKVMAGQAVNDGMNAAQAYMCAALQELARKSNADQVNGIIAGTKQLNDFMKLSGVMKDAELVQIPPGNPANKAMPLNEQEGLQLLQDIRTSTLLWASRWPEWQYPAGNDAAQRLKLVVLTAYDEGRTRIAADAGRVNDQMSDRNTIRQRVYKGVKAEFNHGVIEVLPLFQTASARLAGAAQTMANGIGSVTGIGALATVTANQTGPNATEVEAAGETGAKKLLDATKEQTHSTFANFMMELIMTQWMGGILPALCFVWLGLIELLLLQFTLFLPLWIYPKTEASATKALHALVMVACFIPVYIPVLFACDRLFYFTLGAAGNGGILGLTMLFGPWGVAWLALIALACPLLAVVITIKVLKNIMTGMSFVGGVLKGALTGLGTIAVAATPMGRVAGIAAAGALGNAAAGAENQARAPGTSAAAAARHRAAARTLRGLAGAVDYAQETAGKMFGVDEKYIDRSYTPEENRRGLMAAQKAAGRSGILAAFHGEGASGVIARMEKSGEEHHRREELREKPGSPPVNDAIAAQKEATEEMTRAVQQLTSAVETLPPRQDVSSMPSAPFAAAVRHAPPVPEAESAWMIPPPVAETRGPAEGAPVGPARPAAATQVQRSPEKAAVSPADSAPRP